MWKGIKKERTRREEKQNLGTELKKYIFGILGPRKNTANGRGVVGVAFQCFFGFFLGVGGDLAGWGGGGGGVITVADSNYYEVCIRDMLSGTREGSRDIIFYAL